MTKRYGVIDLGSNTFHLLIAEHNISYNIKTTYKKRIFTSLSEGGIKYIKPERIIAGLDALKDFKNTIDYYNCAQLRAIGTAILRTASNSEDFIMPAEKILGIKIEIIDGIKEAEYIYKGITLSPEINVGTHLVMDIGGGSTEFILIHNGIKLYQKSFVIGVGTLYAIFHNTEPISPIEIDALTEYVHNITQELRSVIQTYRPEYLTGASGSFEVLQLMSDKNASEIKVANISPSTFIEIYNQIVSSDLEARSRLEGMPIERVKLIVVGMVFKKAIFDLMQPKMLYVAPFALKEGILQDMVGDIKISI